MHSPRKDAQLIHDIAEVIERSLEVIAAASGDTDDQLIRRMEDSIQRSLEALAELKLSAIESKEVFALRESTQTLLMQLGAFRRSREH